MKTTALHPSEQAALDGAILTWERWERWHSATPSEESDQKRKAAGAAVDRIRARIARRIAREGHGGGICLRSNS